MSPTSIALDRRARPARTPIHIGHSTGGGEVARYVARAKPGRVAKAVLISAVAADHGEDRDAIPTACRWRCSTRSASRPATNRAQFFYDFTMPFFGYNRDGAEVKEGVRRNWWRQGMTGGALAHYDSASRPSPRPTSPTI